jgi:hypothetical protein
LAIALPSGIGCKWSQSRPSTALAATAWSSGRALSSIVVRPGLQLDEISLMHGVPPWTIEPSRAMPAGRGRIGWWLRARVYRLGLRRLALLRLGTLAVVVLVGWVGTAAASTLAKPSLRLVPNPVKAGHVVTVKGSADGCGVGDTVTVISHAFSPKHTFAGVPAVLTKVRAGGSFHTSTTIPPGRRAGVYSVTARCGGGNLGVLAHLHVTH